MGVERGGRTDLRQRRAFQKLAADALGTLGLLAGTGISFDTITGTINVGLATNPGLRFDTNLLTVDLRDTDPGLELTANGIGVLLAASAPCLSNNGGLHVLLGSTASTVCVGDDARLSDARTPTAHKTSHQAGGTDAIPLDTLAAPTDVTTLNATSSAHGLLPKLSGSASTYLDGTGVFSTPPTTWNITGIKTGTYTAVINDLVRIDDSAGGFTVTLPTAVGQDGKMISLKKVATSVNTTTVATTGGQTIDGSATASMVTSFMHMQVVSDGANWLILT